MSLHELSPAPGARRRRRRVGRGIGSGRGKTSGRGHKGQNSRSGGGVRRGFEGGQMPLYMRVPKFGFNNKFRRDYAAVNVGDLVGFPAEAEIDPDALVAAGLVKLPKQGEGHFGGLVGIKILGGGDLDRALVVKAHAFTVSAKAKIEAAGGRAEVI